ncbi:helix-turn-helix protein [Dinghuibacter silviterrae]|uniref:Helix-turn-helix protein n=2 Tax=Dinghuibacter silviterrae TaxID=1539049 RepID=A0A4R8DUS8_9BACT|nr:helix-turn-helix protein [Dinghuibacter silviterrae]
MNKNTVCTKSVLESIHSLRRNREYSQDFMAYKLGISQNAFSKLESGKTPLTMERFFKIAELLQVSPVELLEGEVRVTGLAAASA